MVRSSSNLPPSNNQRNQQGRPRTMKSHLAQQHPVTGLAPSIAPSDTSRPSTYRGRVRIDKSTARTLLSEPDDQPINVDNTLINIQRIVAANEHLEETDDARKELVLTPVYQNSPPTALDQYFPSHSFLDLPFKCPSYKWDRCFNFFHLPCGPMSVTLMDVVAITGLPVDGFEVSSVLGTTPEEESIDYSIPPKCPGFVPFISQSAGLGVVDKLDEEEVTAFMLCLICKFMVCSPSKQCTPEYIKLAKIMATGHRRLTLGQFVLANLYRSLYSITAPSDTSPLGVPCVTMWILQIWAWMYFPDPEISPSALVSSTSLLSYGALYASRPAVCDSFEKAFTYFWNLRIDRSSDQFFILRNREHGATWFRAAPDDTDDDRVREAWGNYCLPLDLPVGLDLSNSKTRFGFEFYSPSLFCRQLGFFQRVPVPLATSRNRCCHLRLTTFKKQDLEDAHEEMFNARENVIFRMPPFLPNCSPSFQSWWASKRVAKPRKRRVASNQSSDDEENEVPLKVNRKKKPTLNASAIPASSNPSDDHPIAEVKKPKMTKPSATISPSPLPALKPASFIPQVTPSALGLSTSSNPFKTSASTPFGYTSGPSTSTSVSLKVSPSKEDSSSKLATPMTPSAWIAKTPSATPPSVPSPPKEALSASKTTEPSAKKTLDVDAPLDLTLTSPTGRPAKKTLSSPRPATPKLTLTKTSFTPSSDTVAKLNRLSSDLDQAEKQRKKLLKLERKITDLQAELTSLKAHRAALVTKREKDTRERMDRLETQTKELMARHPEIDEIDHRRAYLQFQIDQLLVDVEAWNDFLPPRNEAENGGDKDGDGESKENS
ncbi:hypothetical protein CCACVL1_07852 [Corchorus capsularis]|uniref:Aminotransferase-like plant mobile domain-containing protein n=1 Tax=Corchorus capsularis TaxID=210143 RepID=A0A1R3J3N0_COCAP|nr:hypothetical protein CCACVL1_07852 [Corchorus capsularis]